MPATANTYTNILVAIDFSPHSAAALELAIWLARKTGVKVTLAHALRDVRQAVYCASYQGKLDLLYGDGDLFQRQIRGEADSKLCDIVAQYGESDLDIGYETLLGEPFVELTHAVQAERYDLVLAGTRGLASWEEFFIGSTAKRLVRKCPSTVWIVKDDHVRPPGVVLAATDFSQVSLKAMAQAMNIAHQANAELHALHVVDSLDVPEHVIQKNLQGDRLRSEINDETATRLDAFLKSAKCQPKQVRVHISWGTPWKEISRTAERVHADLIAMGTTGRNGIKGLLLGNTAEKVLSACPCGVLTVKPDGFVSPISPAFWQLHPPVEKQEASGAFGTGGLP